MTATIYETPDEALDGVSDGARVMVGGFVSASSPTNLIFALKRRGTRNLTVMATNIGFGDRLDELCEDRQIAKAIASFAVRASSARASRFEEQYRAGEVELELVPQGTLAERIRAGGAGIGGFLTRTGVGTQVAEGKDVLSWQGEEWLLERPLRADVAILKAHRADRLGNLSYRMAGRNFNAVMATAADLVIVEVEEIVETGELSPNEIHTPAVYVDRIVRCDPVEVRWDGR
ncbi:MAG: 3-oxoacid CoA-transferase subunit A [Chloroflexota bacterium]|nr:3-oxoacid CoA-transferase subunit A [Chloroflexota bacterium]